MKKTILLLAVLFTTGIFFSGCGKGKENNFITIGTGGVTGVYYPTGGAISKMINAQKGKYGIRASVESTPGSVYNINSVINGDLEFGITQSDRQYQAVNGLAEWKESGPQNKLRSIFSIHPESVTLVVAVKSRIKSIKDLKGKRVNLGNPGSGQLQNSKDTLDAFSITEKSIKAEYIKAVDAPNLLHDEKIDAFFYTVGHPNGSVKEATTGRIKVKIIDISGKELDKLIEIHPYYARAEIDINSYPNAYNTKNVSTFGVKATFITSADMKNEIVYAITKEVFDNLEKFKKLHPAYSVLTKKNMLDGLTAPVHPGALKYYRESGLIKYIDPNLIKK